MKPSALRFSLTFLLCLLSVSPIAWSRSDTGRKGRPYPARAENETLPALSDFCNEAQERTADLRHMKDELWFLYDQNNDAKVETYNPTLCALYSDLFLDTCHLIESLKSYNASTCPSGSRLDWASERNSRKYRPCVAGCPTTQLH